MSNITAQDLDRLAEFFKRKAKSLYQQTGEGVYAVRSTRSRSLSLLDFAKDFKASARLNLVDTEHLGTLDKHMQTLGLSGFEEIGIGNSARCYKSQNMVVRIGPTPAQQTPSRVEYGDLRDCCPMVLQVHHRVSLPQVRAQAEILPHVAMLQDDEIPDLFKNTILTALLDKTCFDVNNEYKDLAVLPDGTPIYVDPGAINLRSWDKQPTARDFEIIRENTYKLNLPEPLSWVLPDGRFKQELFFPKPVNALDLVL